MSRDSVRGTSWQKKLEGWTTTLYQFQTRLTKEHAFSAHCVVSADRRNLEAREQISLVLETPHHQAAVKVVPDLHTENGFPQNKLRSLLTPTLCSGFCLAKRHSRL